MYYIIELFDLTDSFNHSVLVEEKDLGSFLTNYDKEKYRVVNVYGVGNLSLEFRDFLKKDNNLEHGETK